VRRPIFRLHCLEYGLRKRRFGLSSDGEEVGDQSSRLISSGNGLEERQQNVVQKLTFEGGQPLLIQGFIGVSG
jgi:hypothetical protein